jgi:adenylate cyclase
VRLGAKGTFVPGPDIFISYAHPDRETARLFADSFAAQGFEVWWDNSLQAGEIFDERIEAALRAAKAVVVLWSPHSVASRWVRAEATLADRNKTLVPATIAACERPIVFELTHTAALAHWRGDGADAAWQAFLGNIRKMMGSEAPAAIAAPAPAAELPKLDQLSIVVLPFANMSNDPEQDYFADGISEDIITDLSKVSALSVIARNTAFTFKGKSVDVKHVASQLNVTHVLEGSVRKSGNRVRITAQLIDGSAGDHLWAERYDRDLDDIFALQDEISQAIVGALKLKLLPQEKAAIEDRGTDNAEAYDLYLRAMAFSQSYRPDDATRAVELLRRVLALDPSFAQGWYGLGRALSRARLTTAGDAAELIREGVEAHRKVVELAPDAWFTQFSLAMFHLRQREWAQAEASVSRAAETAPASSRINFLTSWFLSEVGRPAESLDFARLMLRAEPLSLEISFQTQFLYHFVGMDDAAWAEYERSKDLAGDRGIVEWHALLRKLAAGADLALIQQALRDYLPHESLSIPVFHQVANDAISADAARDMLRAAADDPYYQDATRQGVMAMIAIALGDVDLTLAMVRRGAVDLESTTISGLWAPALAPMRRDPRFKDILRDLKLVDYWRISGRWSDLVRPLGDDDFEVIG